MATMMEARRKKYALFAAVYVIVVLALLAGINWLASRHATTFDTTSNKRYSLSEQTGKVVRNLKEEVQVTYWDYPDQLRGAKDLLDRYGLLSDKFKVSYVDGNRNPKMAREKNIKAPGTILLEQGTKREEAKGLTEEEVTGALIRLLKGTSRTICFVQGSGERSIEDSSRGGGYAQVKALIEKSAYKTLAISLLEKNEIPAECTVVVVAGPRFDYPAPIAQTLQAFVEKGGSGMFLLDPPLQLGQEKVAENPELAKVLAGWGVTLNRDLVIDTSRAGQLFGLSEATPLVAEYESHPIVREMERVATAFPLVRSLTAKSEGKATTQELFKTLKTSFATKKLDKAEIEPDPANDKAGPLAVAAAGSVSTDKPNTKGRFVVVGSSMWPSNSILRFQGNSDLFLNMVNWLTQDEDLISIRPKDPDNRPLQVTAAQMLTIRTVSQFLLPLAAIAGGLFVWWKRR
jgi:ABC-type uncharacterized transport system involved in gliding motility auxiliary subunit